MGLTLLLLASFPRPTTGNEASNFYRLRSSNASMDCPFLDPKSGADFKLDQFLAAPCETFDPHYGKQGCNHLISWSARTPQHSTDVLPTGVGGYDGDGDITKSENLDAFREYVLEHTDCRGVHCVMADGVSRTVS